MLTLILAPAIHAEEKIDNYISDDLYLHAHWTGHRIRILGSVEAGTKVSIISNNTSAKYTQIIDTKGRKGWVETKFVSHKASLKAVVPTLEAELAQVKSALESATSGFKSENTNPDRITRFKKLPTERARTTLQ